MGLKTFAMQTAPVVAGVLLAGALMYYAGNSLAILKDAQTGFANGNNNIGSSVSNGLSSLTGGLL